MYFEQKLQFALEINIENEEVEMYH